MGFLFLFCGNPIHLPLFFFLLSFTFTIKVMLMERIIVCIYDKPPLCVRKTLFDG